MATLPQASTTVVDTAGAIAAGVDNICLIAPVTTLDDGVPRIYGGPEAIYSVHGYSEGVEYAALHAEQARKPIVFCGIPIATAGAVSNEDTSGNSDTCVTTLTEGADGTLTEHEGVLTVDVGGTIGTDQIILSLSLDGGVTTKKVRLGTATSYTIPFVGLTIAFAAGDLTTGETIHTWDASGPLGDSTGWALAKAKLAESQKATRTWLIIGDMPDATAANAVNTLVEAYDTANERFVAARMSVREAGAGETTKALWMAGIDADFETVDAARRVSLSAGRGRVLSPFTGWQFKRPVSWALSIREYQHDVHIAPWRKSDGPTGFNLYDTDGSLVEWDDRVDGSAGVAARFTVFRTFANGPNGAFIALGLTRASDASLLSYTHNQAVVDVAQTVVQAATEEFIGRGVTLTDDGYATSDELAALQSEVNGALDLALLANVAGEGARASKAVWTPASDDILNIPGATLNGTLELNLLGTIHSVATTIRVVSGGQ